MKWIQRVWLTGCWMLFGMMASAQVQMTIHELQGSGPASPYIDTAVQVEAIVTSVTYNGFFAQMPDDETDADPLTSEGVFVYTGDTPTVSAGDRVRITGTVSEYYQLTEIGGSPDVEVLSIGHALPAAIPLGPDFPNPDQEWPCTDLERVEGMLVSITDGLLVSGVDENGKAYATTGFRSYRDPGIRYPGEPGLPVWDGNPEVFQIVPDRPTAEVVGGSRIVHAVGPLSFSYDEYLLIAEECQLDTPPYPVAAPARPDGQILLATQNLHQLSDGSSGYADRLVKMSAVIRQLFHGPDILGFQELGGRDELEDLADRLNSDDPGLGYTFHYGRYIGYLVRNTVSVTGTSQIQASETFQFNSTTYDLHDRPPLLLECEVPYGGDTVDIAVILVHLRSLNGIDEANGAFVRQKRYLQSLRLSQYIGQYQLDHPGRPLYVMGDFNAFPFTDGYVDMTGQIAGNPDPLGAMISATDEFDPDLVILVDGDDYTFVHEGTAQVLDQVLASANGLGLVRHTEVVHHCADAPGTLETDTETLMGMSDHDGVLVYLGEPQAPIVDSLVVGNGYAFSAAAHDPDGGPITAFRWQWVLDDTSETWTRTGQYTPPFQRPGQYTVSVSAMDDEGSWSPAVQTVMDVTVDEAVARPIPLDGQLGDYQPVDYLVNAGESVLPVQLMPVVAGTAADPLDIDIPAGGKLWLNDPSILPEDTDLLTLAMNSRLPVLCEFSSATARLMALLETPSSDMLYVPHIAENTTLWDTDVFVSAAASGTTEVTVPAGGTTAITDQAVLTPVEALLPDPVTVEDSWARVTDAVPNLSGIEMFVKRDNDGAATELVARPSEFLYIPHVPTNTSIFWTGYAFLNTGEATANLQFTFYGAAGQVVDQVMLTIPANAKMKGLMVDLFPDAAGEAQWGTVLADQPIIGIELYGTYNAGICGFTLPDISRTRLVMPSIWTGEGLWTGVAITNPGTETAALTIRLLGSDGSIKGERTDNLAGGLRKSFVVDDYFSEATVEASDYVLILSDRPLTAIEAGGDLDRSFMVGLAAGR